MDGFTRKAYLAALTLFCLLGSAFYSFVGFALVLKSRLNMSQSDVDLIGAGAYIGVNALQVVIATIIASKRSALLTGAVVALIFAPVSTYRKLSKQHSGVAILLFCHPLACRLSRCVRPVMRCGLQCGCSPPWQWTAVCPVPWV
jgi:hypothetical protein